MKTMTTTKMAAHSMLADLTNAMHPDVYAFNYREFGWPTDAYDLLTLWRNELEHAIAHSSDSEIRYTMRHIQQSMNEQCILGEI